MASAPSTPARSPTPTMLSYPTTPVGALVFGGAVVPHAFMLAGSPTAEQFQEEKKQLVELNKKLKKILDAANLVNFNLGNEVNNLKLHHETLVKKTEALESDLQRVMRDLEVARTSDADFATKNIVLEQRLADLIEELRQLVLHLDEYTTALTNKLHGKQSDLANLTKEANELGSMIAQLEQKIAALVNQRIHAIAEMEAARLALAKAKVAKDHLDLEKSNIDTKNKQLKDALAAYGGRDVHDWYRGEHDIRVEEERGRIAKSFETELALTKKKIAAEFEASFSHSHQKWQVDQKRLADVNGAIVGLEKTAAEHLHTQSDLEAEKARLKISFDARVIIVERLGAAITKTKEVEAAKLRLSNSKIKNKVEIDALDKRIAELKARLGVSAESSQFVALTPEIERYQNLLELADFKMSHSGRAPKVQKTA